MEELDVRGLSCPEPVFQVKIALEKGKKPLRVRANEAHTVKNIERFVEAHGASVSVTAEGEDFVLVIS